MTASTHFRFSLANFLLFSIYGASGPYLPLLLRGLGWGDAALGLLLGFVEAVGILGPLAVARIADRRGLYRPALAFSGLATALAFIPLVTLRGLGWTLASLALFALGIRSLVPVMDSSAMSLLSRAAAAGRAVRGGYGSLRVWGTVGYVTILLFLQALGLERAGPPAIALWMGGAATLFVLSLAFLPEVDPPRGRNYALPDTTSGTPARMAARRLDPVFALGLLIIALSRLAMAPVASFFSLYVTDELGIPAVGALWAVAACAEIPLLVLSTRIIARTGPMRAIAIGAAAIVIRLGIYALVPNLGGAIAGQLLHALCYGLFQPAAVAFVSARVPPERRTEGMALFMGLGVGLPALAGSALGGIVVEAAGYHVLFGLFSLAALASLGLWALTRRRFEP